MTGGVFLFNMDNIVLVARMLVWQYLILSDE
jgi:hypothetical protein